jgi:hypothetical protein
VATFLQLTEVRLSINDPVGGAERIVDFLEVATLPAVGSAVAQTSYKLTTNGTYNLVVDGAFTVIPVQVSDSRIGGWIDAFGIDGAIRKSIQAIISGLASQLQLVRNSDGAEESEWIRLNDLHKFYRQLLADLPTQETVSSTGLFMATKTPEIAGGNL